MVRRMATSILQWLTTGPPTATKTKNIKIQVVHHAFHLVTISGSVIS